MRRALAVLPLLSGPLLLAGALTRCRLKRGSFRSVVDLPAAIHRYIAAHNAAPRPFAWTKTCEQITSKLHFSNAPV